MTVKLSVDDARATSQIVEAWTSRLLDVLSDLRVAWRMVGAKVQEHIAERWTNDYGGLAPLATSTLYAKAKRFGYYKRPPGAAGYLRRTGERAYWWTGASMGQALSRDAFQALKTSLVMDFGRDSEPRRNLERMHFGGETRPPRPVYDIDRVRQIADEWVNKFVDRVLSSTSVDQQAAFRR